MIFGIASNKIALFSVLFVLIGREYSVFLLKSLAVLFFPQRNVRNFIAFGTLWPKLLVKINGYSAEFKKTTVS